MPPDYFPYDRAFRELIQRLPYRFTEILFNKPVKRVLNPTFPSVEERKADFVGLLETNEIVHVEIQLHYDKELPKRLVEYALRINRAYGAFPIQVILWIGEEKIPYVEEYELGPIRFRCRAVDIKEIDGERLLESSDPDDYVLAVLCKRGEGFWMKLLERLKELPPRRRESYLKKVFYFSRLRKDVLSEFEKLKEEVGDMPIVIDINQDPLYLRGIQQGIEQGIKQGIHKGLLYDAQELLIDALEVKFGEVSEEIKERIKRTEDRELLKKLHRLVIKAETFEEVKKELESVLKD
uniref:Transposase (putative) YhgA-like domain-containing protein n=1 Tax=Caldimicrobium thiodismutans TaxID=1653476 RepID=A0A832GNF4_9BACT